MATKKYRVGFRTSRSIEQIESWLRDHCKSEWDVQLAGISDDLREKTLAVYFHSKDDAIGFRQLLASKARSRTPVASNTNSPYQGASNMPFKYG